MIELQSFRASILENYGANSSEIEELLVYNQTFFDHDACQISQQFPLESECHIASWKDYIAESKKIGVFETLKQKLVQLNFPIQEGISQTEAYRAAILKGKNPNLIAEATGLVLKEPEKLRLNIYPSLAGEIPVLLPNNREDFQLLVQSLTKRSEPVSILSSMGACMVSGYNNWDRIRRYRQEWEKDNPIDVSEAKWELEFKRLIPLKYLYQDRFIILSDGFYSNILPQDIGLSDSVWRRLSLTIRLEHECTHYFTKRVFKSMRNNVLDELIADYRGIIAATGKYRADWFLHFMGLESFPNYRDSGRLENYRGQPVLSNGAFKILQALVKDAAKNIEHFDSQQVSQSKLRNSQTLILIALTHLTLEELASSEMESRLLNILEQLQTSFFCT